MNKLFIVLMAVCLVSTHAFVKRDAPAPAKPAGGDENYLEKIKSTITDLTKNINDKVQEAFDPEKVKKGFNELVDNVNKVVSDLNQKKA